MHSVLEGDIEEMWKEASQKNLIATFPMEIKN